MYEKSVGDAADLISVAQRLIEAGVNNDDDELIEVGRSKWREAWPDVIADQAVDTYIKDLKEEIS